MLSVNEDMLLAAADCSADNDVEGALGYVAPLCRLQQRLCVPTTDEEPAV